MIDILGTNINSNMRLILLLSSFLVSFILSLLLTKLHYNFGTFVYNIILFVVIYMLAILVYNQINSSSKTKNTVKESFGNKLAEEEENNLPVEEISTEISNVLMKQEESEQIATEMENRNNSVTNVAMNSNSPLTMDEINAYSEEMINNEETPFNEKGDSIINDNNNVVLTKSTLDYMLKTPVNVTINLSTNDISSCSNNEQSTNGTSNESTSTNNNESGTNNNESGTNDGNMFSNIDMNTIANYTLDKQQNYINEYRNSQKCPVCPLVDNRPWSNYESDI